MINRILQALLLLSIAFVLIFGVAPKIIGLGIRDIATTSLINIAPPESQGQVSITNTQFDSGWFRTAGSVNIVFTSPGLDESIGISLDLDIQHGPFFLTNKGPRIGLAYANIDPEFNSSELSQVITQIPFEFPSVEITLLADFDQSLMVDLDVAPINYNQNDTSVIFKGINANLTANIDNSVNLNLSAGNIIVQDSNSQFGFNLAGIEIESYTSQMTDLLAPSTIFLAIPAISSTGPFPFNLTDVSSNSEMQASTIPQAIDIFQNIRVGNIESELPVESLNWTTEIKEAQNGLFRSYYEIIGTIQSQINTNNPTAAMAEATAFGGNMGLLLIQNSLVLNNILQANVYGGDHSVDLNIDWEGIPDRADLNDPQLEEIAAALAIQLKISLDQQAIMKSQFAALVEPYVKQGYLLVENGRILFSASLQNGELTVNGEETPLDQFF